MFWLRNKKTIFDYALLSRGLALFMLVKCMFCNIVYMVYILSIFIVVIVHDLVPYILQSKI